MNRNVLTGALLLSVMAIAFWVKPAQAANEYATVINVKPNYVNVQVPRHRNECQTVEIPIYSNYGGQASTGDTLFGALIGGALGNQVGGGKGKDAATILGAIIGADVANKRAVTGQRQIVGYRQEENCRKISFHETQERLKNYRITYEFNGIQATSFTHNQYKVGDRIPVTVSIQAN